MTDVLPQLAKYLEVSATAIAILATAVTLIAAVRSGVLRRIRIGAFEIEASERDQEQARALIHAVAVPDHEPRPFETEQLAQYYAQVLAQSKTSFWFSLIFASLGFLVIVIAGFRYESTAAGATVAQIIAGIIMDAVAALFFVQSKNAQAAMGQFFDKLRRDRQQAEARKLCDSVTNNLACDALRIQLALHYAEVPTAQEIGNAIIGACIREMPAPHLTVARKEPAERPASGA
jgi:hypothetical protein